MYTVSSSILHCIKIIQASKLRFSTAMSPYSAVATFNSTAITSSLLPHKTNQNATLFNTISLSPNKISSTSQSVHHLFFGYNGSLAIKRRFKPSSPVMEWQDCSAKIEVDVPCSVAYKCYSDREAIPRWMPFISSVKVLEEKPDLSRWSLKYKAFGRDIQFSWLAKNLQPIPNQKIHWRSLEGLPNRGVVRFYPKGPSSCMVELTVSYEVPQILAPVASLLQPFLESLLVRGLERFVKVAKEYKVA